MRTMRKWMKKEDDILYLKIGFVFIIIRLPIFDY